MQKFLKSLLCAILLLISFALSVIGIIVSTFFISYKFDINPTWIATVLVLIGMLLTSLIILMGTGKDGNLYLINKYRYKGLWYGVATVISLIILIDNAFIINEIFKFNMVLKEDFSIELILFHLILVYIVMIECLDNFKSYYIEKNKEKNPDHEKQTNKQNQVGIETSADNERAYYEKLIEEKGKINNDIRYLKNILRLPLLLVLVMITILSLKSGKKDDDFQ